MIWNDMECYGMIWNVMECHGMIWNDMECDLMGPRHHTPSHLKTREINSISNDVNFKACIIQNKCCDKKKKIFPPHFKYSNLS